MGSTFARRPDLAFHGAPSPNRDDLEGVVRVVHRRALRWLVRHGHLERPPREEQSNEAALPSPIEACAAIATQRGTMRTLAQDAGSIDLATGAVGVDSDGPRREGGAVEHEGFNLHAGVRIAAEDDRGRERLCRYGARPPFSLERLRMLSGGRIAYRIKKLGAGRAKHRVMTPLELLARLAALVPPPRYPLVRYHGVLAPHAEWRREIVPRPPTAPGAQPCMAAAEGKKGSCGPEARGRAAAPRGGESRRRGAHADRASEVTGQAAVSGRTASSLVVDEHARALLTGGSAAADASGDVTNLAPNILSVRHWSRLLGGLLYATSPRLRWPELIRRTFDVDVLECPKCHGRIRIVETVAQADAARRILERLGVPVDAPRLARARDPTTLDGEEPDAA
jgi:hypothetical protein